MGDCVNEQISDESDTLEGDDSVAPTTAIERFMRQRIEQYRTSRMDPSLYQSVRNMSQFVSDDYGNRFLIELIQNAHDAQDPSRSDGEIAIVLDAADGPHGCLYAANRGIGFRHKNLKAITNIALSSKAVNAGIGNKGLGFRSVLQVCDWPEIYSVQGHGGRGCFDGYCFRFATVNDFLRHLGNDAIDLAQEMAQNLPCWHVPVPARTSSAVDRFASKGFATVVRLPLKSNDAFEVARSQIGALLGSETPLHLFLDRIERISFDDGTGRIVTLKRSVERAETIDWAGSAAISPIKVAKVKLGDDYFVVASWEIDEKAFRAALQTSLDRGEVPESWKHWEGAARVGVGVPLGVPLEVGKLYCFLPLGPEGKAPFAGYINANFYTKMDRRGVDLAIRLNDLFIRMAARVSCQLVGFLAKSDWREAPSAVVSLLCWEDAYVETVKEAMGDEGQGILSREFLPVRGAGDTIAWASPKQTHSWTTSPDACLSPKSICEVAGGRVLVESLTLNQRAALDSLYLRLRNANFSPHADLVADWVEKIAIKMHKEKVAPERWASFYDELSVALVNQPAVLFGKRFLLSVSGDLIRSELPPTPSSGRSRRAADVYFAPVQSIDADVDDDESKRSLPLESLPANLRDGFALLSREVPWIKDDGGPRAGRSFLLSGKLAREYDTRDVLRTLAGVTRSTAAVQVRQQALEWAFRLWSSGRSLSDKETRSAEFFVPTAEGWTEAEAAMFGSGWGTPNGKKLHALLRLTADVSDDLGRSFLRLLPDYSEWPISYGAQEDWVRFLIAAGVTDSLHPIGGEEVQSTPANYPRNLVSAVVQALPEIPDALRVHWRELLAQDCSKMFGSRLYRAEMRSWRVPGQNEIGGFGDEVRRDYAVQVAIAIRSILEDHRTFRAVRADTGPSGTEQHRLSTPLYAFVTGAEWIPVMRPGGKLRFVKPSLAWYFVADEDRAPRFLEFVVRQVAEAIDPPTLEWLQNRAHLGLFNDDRHANRALLAMAHAASFRISDVRDIRRFRDIFPRLWVKARQSGQPAAAQLVPVQMGGAIVSVSRAGEGPALAYFDDERDALRKQLLEEVGEPVFDFVVGDDAAAWEWLNASAPERFRRISDEPAEVFVDEVKFDDNMATQLLGDIFGPWIVDFIVCVAEHKGSSFIQATQNTLGRIRRATMNLCVITGHEVQIGHGDERIPLPPSLHGALALTRTTKSFLIAQTAGDALTLEMLAAAAGQLAVAVGSRELTNGLDAALLRLAAKLRDHPGEDPDDTLLAAALGVDTEAIKRTRRLASGDLINMLDLAIPLSACLGTPNTTLQLQQLGSEADPHDDELRVALESLASDIGIPLGRLEERMAHLLILRDLKEEFHLPIATLNAAIAGLGGRYKLLSNEPMHRDVWTRFLRRRLPTICEQLRERCAGTFDRGEPLLSYVSARDRVLTMTADSNWFTAYDDLPESVMDARIAQWIEEHTAVDASDTPLPLPLNEIRSSNGARLRHFLTIFSPVLSAWVRAGGTPASAGIRQAWTDPGASVETCLVRARDSGWLDYRLLDYHEIAHWLTLDDMWPAGHAANPDLAAWGLSSVSLADAEARTKAERVEQQRRRIQVEFAGETLSALKDGYAEIAAAVSAKIVEATALQNVSSSGPALQEMDSAKPSGAPGRHSGRGVPKSPETSMSDEQKMAVGLIGELWAREWLRRRHRLDTINENIWVSGYRDVVLNTTGGSDGLGYDFVVATKSRSHYYEVKASTGNPLRFEMGPTEIGAAQRYRADREHRYHILYLAYVGDPLRLIFAPLPNPFSTKSARKFRAVGKGSVVYEFDPI
jgi:hypothetical protein